MEDAFMYHFLSVLGGVFVAVMIAINGELTSYYGLYSATVVIHLVGLIFITMLLALRRKRFLPAKKLPFHLYLGGAVGVATVVFTNMAYSKISVSAILAIGLLGQCLTSLVFDQYGFLNMPKHTFVKTKLIGIALVVLGIVSMTMDSKMDAFIPIIVSLLSGVSIVVSRTINASLAQQTSVLTSTFFNHGVGLAVSAPILFIAGRSEPMLVQFSLSSEVWIYLGGIMGVGLVTLMNAAVCKISSFYMTLLMFAGQVFAGIVVDIMLSGVFSLNNLIGGVLVAVGLAQNLIVDRRANLRARMPGLPPQCNPVEAESLTIDQKT
jgi:transporter family-2 protein